MARRRTYIKPRSLGAVVQAYRKSPEFEALADSTKRVYLRALSHIGAGPARKTLYEVEVRDIRRRHVIAMRDRHRKTPALANQIVSMFSILLDYAMDLEYIEHNPAKGVKHLPTGSYRRWSETDLSYAFDNLPERHTRAMLVALYTGQRMGDVLRMTWTDYDGQGIQVVQQKTGVKLYIPVHPILKAALEDWRQARKATTIIVDSTGTPYASVNSFSTGFSKELGKHLQLRGLTFHGLRKTAAAMLAEAGCTTHEIAAITGHKTLAMLQHYTAEAEQRTRAGAAITKLSERGTKPLKGKA